MHFIHTITWSVLISNREKEKEILKLSTVLLPFCSLYFCKSTEECLEEKQVSRPNILVPRRPPLFRSFAQSVRTLVPDGTVSVSVSWKAHLRAFLWLFPVWAPPWNRTLSAADLSGELKLTNKTGCQDLLLSSSLSLTIWFVPDIYPMAENQANKISAGESTLHNRDNLQLSGLGFVASIWLN